MLEVDDDLTALSYIKVCALLVVRSAAGSTAAIVGAAPGTRNARVLVQPADFTREPASRKQFESRNRCACMRACVHVCMCACVHACLCVCVCDIKAHCVRKFAVEGVARFACVEIVACMLICHSMRDSVFVFHTRE